MAADILGFELRHFEQVAECVEAVPAGDHGQIAGQLGHLAGRSFAVDEVSGSRWRGHFHSSAKPKMSLMP